jgi:hypothetical protein
MLLWNSKTGSGRLREPVPEAQVRRLYDEFSLLMANQSAMVHVHQDLDFDSKTGHSLSSVRSVHVRPLEAPFGSRENLLLWFLGD